MTLARRSKRAKEGTGHMSSPISVGTQVAVEPQHLQQLIEALAGQGYRVLGPTARDGAIVYDELTSASDLPADWTDEQEGGKYRLKKRGDGALFGYASPAQSWKKYLHPSVLRLWQGQREYGMFRVIEEKREPEKLAFVGVRACDLHAIAIQDKVLLQGAFVDTNYQGRRENAFIVAVNCGQAGGNCFCASMGTGPKAGAGFDLALTEILQDGRHYLVAEVGTELGAQVLAAVPHSEAGEAEKAAAESTVAQARAQSKSLDLADLKEILYRNYDNPLWEQVAKRCMTCANCTMVCPTCFCTNVEEVTDLPGTHTERWRKWDSCFTVDFSYIHGGSIRTSVMSRYRQWMTHKLATWNDQFGTPGCVGCGRCLTWCPVAIDITEQARAIRESERRLSDAIPS